MPKVERAPLTTGDDELEPVGELTPEVASDPKLLGDLINRCRSKLHIRALSMVKRPDVAEDMVHDAFIKAIVSARNGAHVHDPMAYLRQVVHNLCVDYLRRHESHTETSLDEIAPDEIPQVDSMDVHELRERCRTIHEVVSTLPEMQRSALLLATARGLNYEETADVLQVSVHSVRQLLHRARTRVREAVGSADMPLVSPTLTLRVAAEEGRLGIYERVRSAAMTKVGEIQAWAGSLIDRTAAVVPQSTAVLAAAPLLIATLIPVTAIKTNPAPAGVGSEVTERSAPKALVYPPAGPKRGPGRSTPVGHRRVPAAIGDREGMPVFSPRSQESVPAARSRDTEASTNEAKRDSSLRGSDSDISRPPMNEPDVSEPGSVSSPPISPPMEEPPSGPRMDTGDSSQGDLEGDTTPPAEVVVLPLAEDRDGDQQPDSSPPEDESALQPAGPQVGSSSGT